MKSFRFGFIIFFILERNVRDGSGIQKNTSTIFE